MPAVLEAPVEMVEAVAALRLPPRGDRRMQLLMELNTDGGLTPEQKEKLIEHFRWVGYVLVAQSSVGRATALTLNFNHPRRILIRKAEQLFDLFPP
jgi:hypothetical protein